MSWKNRIKTDYSRDDSQLVIEKCFRNNNWSYPSEVTLHDVARIPALFIRSWTDGCMFESRSHCWSECLNSRIDMKEDKLTSKAFRQASWFWLLTSDIAWRTYSSKIKHHKDQIMTDGKEQLQGCAPEIRA